MLFNAGKATVYFVGNPGVADRINTACRKYKLQLIRDYTNNMLPKSDKQAITKLLKIVIRAILFSALMLMFISVYTKG